MPIANSAVILYCAVAYLAVCLAIGAWAMRRTRTVGDFFLAGKNLGLVVAVIAMVANLMSGFGFVGGPGLVYESGMSSLWIRLTGTIGIPLSVVLLGKRLRLMVEARDVLSLPDAVAARYGGRAPRLAMAVAILLGVIGYLGTQILAIGMVLVAVLGLKLPVALLIGLAVLAFYSAAGGIVAGVYVGLFQGLVMLFAAVGAFYYALQAGGGMSHISATLWAMDPEFIGPWGTRGPLTALSWWLVFAVGAVGQPHSITKMMMLRNLRYLKWWGLLALPCTALLSLLWMSLGLSMRYLVETGGQSPLASPDLAAPMFLLNHTPQLLAGIVFAGLLAAIMSTANSFVNLGAAAVIRDIPTALQGRPFRRELFWSRVASALLLIVAAAFALYMESLIALLGTFGWGTFAAAIVPSVAIGLNWKRATAPACVWSISLSLVLNFTLELLDRHGIYSLPYGMNVGCLSLLVSIAVFVAISWFSGRSGQRKLPADIAVVMDA